MQYLAAPKIDSYRNHNLFVKQFIGVKVISTLQNQKVFSGQYSALSEGGSMM